ncbi:hypothetical protein D3C84_983490 [compost metagenome]
MSPKAKHDAESWLDSSTTLANTEFGREEMSRRAVECGLFLNTEDAAIYFDSLTSKLGPNEMAGETNFLSGVSENGY